MPDEAPSECCAPPGTRIGHVHLLVANLDRSIRFYCTLLGFQIQARLGNDAAFLGAQLQDEAGALYHHHIGLNTWQSQVGSPPAPHHIGLYHLSILYPDRRTLAIAVDRVMEAGVALTGATDHGICEAVYLNDPDEIGAELCCDRPVDQWPRSASGQLVMNLQSLDLSNLLSEIQHQGSNADGSER